MLVLFESAAGYAVFKLLDEKKLKKSDDLYKDFETPDKASKIVSLQSFKKFKDTTEALEAATATVEGKMSKTLKRVMKGLVKSEIKDQLLVADAKLGNCIKEKHGIQCVANSSVQELMRCIRQQTESLLSGLPKKELSAMSLGLAHSLSRYKLKFSPDKVDTMIVQAISLLDDLDKELNNYVMRAREWYGWHFPEMSKIVTDNIAYAKVVREIGHRTNAATMDLSEILPEEVETELKQAAEISMGTEVSDSDVLNIRHLCVQVIEISEYRAKLYDYLKSRMLAIAPNLTTLVGELVGARLISHAGSLMNFAKHPASTVQILGAEKALFRALKTKHDTPKYGLIYHASLVGQTNPKIKGKMSRMLAAKAALAVRVDALGEDNNTQLGIDHRAKLERRLRILEGEKLGRVSGTGKAQAKFDKYENKSEVKTYDPAADSTIAKKSKKRKQESDSDGFQTVRQKRRRPSSKTEAPKKKAKTEAVEEPETPKSEKKKKKKRKSTAESDESAAEPETPKSEKKKKKRKSTAETEESAVEPETPEPSSEKKKKKKKKQKKEQDSD